MRKSVAGLLLLMLVVAAAVILRISPYDYAFQDRDATAAASTAQHPAGTDELGRDRMVRVAPALLIGLAGAAAAAAITTAIAATFGLLAAFSPAWGARILLFVSNVFLSLPWLFLLMMARSLLPLTASPVETALTTFLVLAALGWPACARAIYRGAVQLRSAEWMIHGHACGLTTRQLIRCTLCLISFALCATVSGMRAGVHRGGGKPRRARAGCWGADALLGRDAAGAGQLRPAGAVPLGVPADCAARRCTADS